MVIIDVEVPSGFEFDNWRYTDEVDLIQCVNLTIHR